MFVFLSKKIAIPNGVKLRTVAWNCDQGWIACGGEDGMLKVLKLETTQTQAQQTNAKNGGLGGGNDMKKESGAAGVSANAGALAASSNLSMNQTLEGHSGAVIVSKWNEQHKKLTTSDQYGLIIVWVLYKGVWYEEMINNRNKSVVADMQWNNNGQKICIAYEDGAVIVGSVDGHRLWGKDLKQTQLALVQWSPDGKKLLFGTASGELHLYDCGGNFLSKVDTFTTGTAVIKLSSLDWYNGSHGYVEPRIPCLAIAFENGKLVIMRDEKDIAPLILDTSMRYMNIKWNNAGTVLAVAGTQFARSSQGEEKEISVVQFYDPFGQYMRSLKVPGKKISSLSWENGGARLSLAVDSFIYFANVRPDYKWTFFAEDVLVYAFARPGKAESALVFWNTKTNERHVKVMQRLRFLTSCDEFCLLAVKNDDSEFGHTLTVSNAIGTSIDTKTIDFTPHMIKMTKTHVIVASTDIVFTWQFRSVTKRAGALDVIRRKETLREKFFHIDEVPTVNGSDEPQSLADLKQKRPSADPIMAITATENMLLVARQNGHVIQLSLPSVTHDLKHTLNIRVHSMSINCNGSRLAVVDAAGMLKIYEMPGSGGAISRGGGGVGVGGGEGIAIGGLVSATVASVGRFLEVERKDVWDLRWANDNPEMLAIIEKNKLYVIKGTEIEEAIICNGYLCGFDNLQVKTAFVDEIFRDPENLSKDYISLIDTKMLKDARAIISQNGLSECLQFVEGKPHARLWKLVADAALEKLDFAIAQKAMVRCLDYKGLQFIKKLQKLDDAQKQKAEIAAHFGNFDLAEKIYLDLDRKDLAIDMRIQLGDWFRVVQHIKSGGVGDDVMLDKAWNAIGDYYFDRQRWNQAITYYGHGRNTEKLVECYSIVDDYDNLEKVMYNLPENHVLLKFIANKFSAVGLSDQAVTAYLKQGNIKAAIDTCVQLNKWNTAIELAETHKFREIESLLAKYATYLLEKDKRISAIELYRKANYCQKSARLLYELAEEAAKSGKHPLRVKKCFVLAALEVERFHHLTKASKGGNEYSALDGLLAEDRRSSTDTKFLDSVWRGAEAYHFYLLCQRQFYAGNVPDAMKTALHLRNYEDIIEPKIIYALLAIVAFQNSHFGVCSSAFIKLEALPNIPDEERNVYENLALSVFTKFPVTNPEPVELMCTNCSGAILDSETFCSTCHFTFPTCIVSGRPIYESIHFMCHVCKHRAIESEISGLNCCPLCHSTL